MIEEQVYKYLCENHKGQNNLIKNQYLRKKFSITSDKGMRKVIQNIRESEKFPLIIGSVSGNSGGFFCCINEKEEEITINNIEHRANEMLKMTNILKNKKQKKENQNNAKE